MSAETHDAVPHFTENEIARLCDMATVTDWLEQAWRDLGAGEAATTLRVRAGADGLTGSAMAASWPRHQMVGGKLYLTHADGYAFLVAIFSPEQGLVATFDALGLTAVRTAAATALGIRHLAPPDAHVGAVFGTGNQCRPHMEALAQELPLSDLRVWGRDVAKAEAAADWGRAHGIPARAVADAGAAVDDALVVATVTASATPVFDGARLHPAALVCGVGTAKPNYRELDGTTVKRAGFVVSDSAEGARNEAGDLILADAEGVFEWESLVDLVDVIAGRVTPPLPGSEIVLFESQGVALQDVVIATLVHQRSLAETR